VAARGCLGRVCEIAVNARCEWMNLIAHRRWVLRELRSGRRLPLVLVAGALLGALGLGRFGGSNLYRFLVQREELTGSVSALQRKPTSPIDASAPTVATTAVSGDFAAVS